MARTNIVLDDDLVAKAKSATGITTTKELVHYALRELLRRRRQRKLLDLRGQVDWQGDLATLRRGRSFK
jgi:Arc/MetJ family transcription regulator